MNDRLEPLMHRRVMYTVTDQDGMQTFLIVSRKSVSYAIENTFAPVLPVSDL